MQRKTKVYLWIGGGGPLALLALLGWSSFGPPRAVVVSKETTFLSAPLTPDGKVDYVAAVLQRESFGVTPENNAAVLLLQSTWPCELKPDEQLQVCRELGIKPPTTNGLVMINRSPRYQQLITDWASEKWGVDLRDKTKYDFNAANYVEPMITRPWRRDQIPPLAQRVDEHAVVLDRLHQLEQRSEFYFPPPELFSPDASLLKDRYRDVNLARFMTRSMVTRAMMHIGENEPRQAWRDLRSIFLLSRRIPKAPTINDAMSRFAFAGVAALGTERLLSSRQCDRPLLDEMAQFLADLPPVFDPATTIDQSYRLTLLEFATSAASHKQHEYDLFRKMPGFVPLLELPFDPNTMLRRLNQRVDQFTAVMKIDSPRQFENAKNDLDSEIKRDLAAWNNWRPVSAAKISQSVRGVYAADVILHEWVHGVVTIKRPVFRAQATERMLRIAIALEQHHLITGAYPITLPQIAPHLDPKVWRDPYYNNQEMHYRNKGDGFLLYSVFQNGADDDGNSEYGEVIDGEWTTERTRNFDYQNVDLVIRSPMPIRKLTKPLAIDEARGYPEVWEFEEGETSANTESTTVPAE